MRRLLLVEDVFAVADRGVIVVPDVELLDSRPRTFDVELRRPDGSRVRAEAHAAIPFVDPPQFPPRLRHVVTLKALTKEDVPVGTEIFIDDMDEEVLAASASYRAHSREQGAATERGDCEKGNMHYDGIVRALRSLRELGKPGERALLDLVGDLEPWTRCWAATHALAIDSRRARLALAELAALESIIGFTARTVLDEFDKGTLELP